MSKTAIVLLAGTDSHADLGRAVNALETARQLKEDGQEVVFLFDGAGTEWVPRVTDKTNDLNELYQTVQPTVQGACKFCAGAFHVEDEIAGTDVPLVDETRGHPDMATLIQDGYQVVTF